MDCDIPSTGQEIPSPHSDEITPTRRAPWSTCLLLQRLSFLMWPASFGGTRWRSRLRHCATGREEAGSIPDGHYGPWRSTQSLSGISPGGKSCRCVGLTTLPPSCADRLEILKASTTWSLRTCRGLLFHVAIPTCVRSWGFVGSVYAISEPTGSDKRYLSDKIMILSHPPYLLVLSS